MIRDGTSQRFNMVIVKSLSRFGRDTLEAFPAEQVLECQLSACRRSSPYTDDLHLEETSGRKAALFCCIPDSGKTPNLPRRHALQATDPNTVPCSRPEIQRSAAGSGLSADEAFNIALPIGSFLSWF